MPRLSVLIPAFQAEKFIAAAVASVLKQAISDMEVVIASDDGQDYIRILAAQGIRDPRIHCASTGATRSGLSHARNTALKYAKGNMIALLDADDAFADGYIDAMLPRALTHGMALSQVHYLEYGANIALPNCAKAYAEGKLPLEDILLACLHAYSPIIFDREKLPHLWNESVPLLEDAVFLASACDTLGTVWYQSRPLYEYYRRPDSLCNAPDAARRFLEAGRIIINLLEREELPMRNPRTARILASYIHKNDRIEHAFEKAVHEGKARDYHDFIGRNSTMLHAPLI